MLCLSHSFGQLERTAAFIQIRGDLSRALSSYSLSALGQGCVHVSATQQLWLSVEGSGGATLALSLCFSAQPEFSGLGKYLNRAQQPSAAA